MKKNLTILLVSMCLSASAERGAEAVDNFYTLVFLGIFLGALNIFLIAFTILSLALKKKKFVSATNILATVHIVCLLLVVFPYCIMRFENTILPIILFGVLDLIFVLACLMNARLTDVK